MEKKEHGSDESEIGPYGEHLPVGYIHDIHDSEQQG
jgi:hypothetical protein